MSDRSFAVIVAMLLLVPRTGRAQQGAPAPLVPVASADDRTAKIRAFDVHADSSGGVVASRSPAAAPARARRLTPVSVNAPPRLPLAAGTGPGVLHIQTLLAGANFSSGVIDGRWGESTRQAVRAFRFANGLGLADVVDDRTYQRLRDAVIGRVPVVEYTLTDADVRGPFRKVPKSPYAKAALDCLCYTSAIEKLGERFHTTPELLQQLNPDIAVDRFVAGTTLLVPNVLRAAPPELAARLVVDKRGGTIRGLDALGTTLFLFPASVGSDATPSPGGRLRVRSVTHDPWYQYDPGVLATGRPSGRTADIPPGPNSPVGVVWIQLSKAHVGIHGTPDPEQVGRAESHGCVRLTNWDARYLAGLVRPGLEVEFHE